MIDSLQLGSSFLLVSSAFQMPKSLGCFRKLGLELHEFGVDFYSVDRAIEFGDLVPSENALFVWTILFHELAGLGVIL